MRRLEVPIEVAFREGQEWPYLFRLNGQSFEVLKRLETWVRESRWWKPGGSERRVYHRVVARGGGGGVICVLCEATGSDRSTWSLHKIEN